MTVTLVTMAHPCQACFIAANLLEGLFIRLAADEPSVKWEIITLNHPRELKTVDGLEVERLPAVLIDGEQVSAGNVLHKRQLMEYLKLYS